MNKHTKRLEPSWTCKIDCKACCGLCCTALCFVKSEGFPENKPAGKPCVHLAEDFKCRIHPDLGALKMRGCIGYDCFGAGNFVTQVLYQGETWKTLPKQAKEMFDVFSVVFSLFQIRYYLEEVKTLSSVADLWVAADQLIAENETLSRLTPKEIIALDLVPYRSRANAVLKEVCHRISKVSKGATSLDPAQYLGKRFKNKDLSGLDLSMKLLIGAGFEGCTFKQTAMLGADTRDADFSNADLSEAIFLTQGQVNAAKGNKKTKLPQHLEYPPTWI